MSGTPIEVGDVFVKQWGSQELILIALRQGPGAGKRPFLNQNGNVISGYWFSREGLPRGREYVGTMPLGYLEDMLAERMAGRVRTYTAIISNGWEHRGGSVEEAVVVKADALHHVVGEAQVKVASRILEEICGQGAEPWDHEQLWMRIYDKIPVVAIIEGTPRLILNDDIYEEGGH